jgi:Zn-dependent peptidase ImmA (M78 family)
MVALRTRLSLAGVKRGFLNKVVLPAWWDDTIAQESGGFREAAGYIAAYLGFSLESLVDSRKELAYAQRAGVKYKKAVGVSHSDVHLATQYALGVARTAAAAFSDAAHAAPVPQPEEWRRELLEISDKRWVCLRHILKATWGLGIPVIQVKNMPDGSKKPDALTTMVGSRPVIVVMNGRKSPSWIAFIVAHELGHIHHKHLKADETLVDEKINSKTEEANEIEANDFAALLLTGHRNLGLHSSSILSPAQLAKEAKAFGKDYRIAPGVAALNYAFTTAAWPLAMAAVGILEKNDDAATYLKAALETNFPSYDLSEESREWILRATSDPA